MEEKKYGYNIKTKKFLINNRGITIVEATIIIPMLVFLIVEIINLSFFLYNRCSLERACDMAALRGSSVLWLDSNERFGKAVEGMEQILQYNLLGAYEISQDVKVQGEEVCVHLEGNFLRWNYATKETKRVINPVKYARKCAKAKILEEKLED